MNATPTDPVAQMITQVLGQLLRQPEPQRDIELERALVRLQAARSDAAYVLLHRVMVLEAALLQLKSGEPGKAVAGSANTATVAPTPLRLPAAAPMRSFLRDAAVVTAGVTAGVVVGQVLWQGLSDSPLADGTDGTDVSDGGDLLGIDGWL